MLSLPAKLGVIGVIDPSNASNSQYEASRKVSTPLVSNMQSPAVNEDAEQVPASSSKAAVVHQLPQNHQAAIEQSCIFVDYCHSSHRFWIHTMFCVCGMDGPSAAFHLTVSVVYPSALIMNLPVRKVHYPSSGTTGSEIY